MDTEDECVYIAKPDLRNHREILGDIAVVSNTPASLAVSESLKPNPIATSKEAKGKTGEDSDSFLDCGSDSDIENQGQNNGLASPPRNADVHGKKFIVDSLKSPGSLDTTAGSVYEDAQHDPLELHEPRQPKIFNELTESFESSRSSLERLSNSSFKSFDTSANSQLSIDKTLTIHDNTVVEDIGTVEINISKNECTTDAAIEAIPEIENIPAINQTLLKVYPEASETLEISLNEDTLLHRGLDTENIKFESVVLLNDSGAFKSFSNSILINDPFGLTGNDDTAVLNESSLLNDSEIEIDNKKNASCIANSTKLNETFNTTKKIYDLDSTAFLLNSIDSIVEDSSNSPRIINASFENSAFARKFSLPNGNIPELDEFDEDSITPVNEALSSISSALASLKSSTDSIGIASREGSVPPNTTSNGSAPIDINLPFDSNDTYDYGSVSSIGVIYSDSLQDNRKIGENYFEEEKVNLTESVKSDLGSQQYQEYGDSTEKPNDIQAVSEISDTRDSRSVIIEDDYAIDETTIEIKDGPAFIEQDFESLLSATTVRKILPVIKDFKITEDKELNNDIEDAKDTSVGSNTTQIIEKAEIDSEQNILSKTQTADLLGLKLKETSFEDTTHNSSFITRLTKEATSDIAETRIEPAESSEVKEVITQAEKIEGNAILNNSDITNPTEIINKAVAVCEIELDKPTEIKESIKKIENIDETVIVNADPDTSETVYNSEIKQADSVEVREIEEIEEATIVINNADSTKIIKEAVVESTEVKEPVTEIEKNEKPTIVDNIDTTKIRKEVEETADTPIISEIKVDDSTKVNESVEEIEKIEEITIVNKNTVSSQLMNEVAQSIEVEESIKETENIVKNNRTEEVKIVAATVDTTQIRKEVEETADTPIISEIKVDDSTKVNESMKEIEKIEEITLVNKNTVSSQLMNEVAQSIEVEESIKETEKIVKNNRTEEVKIVADTVSVSGIKPVLSIEIEESSNERKQIEDIAIVNNKSKTSDLEGEVAIVSKILPSENFNSTIVIESGDKIEKIKDSVNAVSETAESLEEIIKRNIETISASVIKLEGASDCIEMDGDQISSDEFKVPLVKMNPTKLQNPPAYTISETPVKGLAIKKTTLNFQNSEPSFDLDFEHISNPFESSYKMRMSPPRTPKSVALNSTYVENGNRSEVDGNVLSNTFVIPNINNNTCDRLLAKAQEDPFATPPKTRLSNGNGDLMKHSPCAGPSKSTAAIDPVVSAVFLAGAPSNFGDDAMDVDEDMPAEELFSDSANFDFLLNRGGHKVANSKQRDLSKESLFVKFDPLVSAQPLNPAGYSNALPSGAKTPRAPLEHSSGGDENSWSSGGLAESCSSDSSSAAAITNKINQSGIMSTGSEQTLVNLSMKEPPSHHAPIEKPTQVVTPAINRSQSQVASQLTPKSSPNTTQKIPNVTSPALTAIDRLISLTPATPAPLPPPPPPPPQERNGMDPEVHLELVRVKELWTAEVSSNRAIQSELEGRLSELEKRLVESEEREKTSSQTIRDVTTKRNHMSTVVEEYERSIASLLHEREATRRVWESERSNLIRERDEATQHLAGVEHSFNDVHAKYERSKAHIMDYRANIESLNEAHNSLKDAAKKQDSRYDALRLHAISQIETLNREMESMKRGHDLEVAKLMALLKKSELTVETLQENINQKNKENENLTEICNGLIQKMSN